MSLKLSCAKSCCNTILRKGSFRGSKQAKLVEFEGFRNDEKMRVLKMLAECIVV